ncbi:MAG: EF-hand domain-containing protein [Arenimonas sp.]
MKDSRTLLLLLLVCGAAAGTAVSAQAQDDPDVNAAFARMDSDRDGQLTLQEFEKGTARPYGWTGEGVVYQRLPAQFRALDGDQSGYLEPGEYAQLAQRWQGAGSPPDFAGADRNGDARIDFREFAAIHAPDDSKQDTAAR